MTNPNLDNLQKEIDNLSSEESKLLEKIENLRAAKATKQIDYQALVEKMPMAVKVIKCLQKNGKATDPTFLLENNPVKYHK